MHDAAKKPSIDALLNSQPTSQQIPGTPAANGVQPSPQVHSQYTYHPQTTFGSASSFPLKAANWFDPASQAIAAQRAHQHRRRSDPHQGVYTPPTYVYTSPGVEPIGGQFPARVELTQARWPAHAASQPSTHPRQSEGGRVSLSCSNEGRLTLEYRWDTRNAFTKSVECGAIGLAEADLPLSHSCS